MGGPSFARHKAPCDVWGWDERPARGYSSSKLMALSVGASITSNSVDSGDF